MNKTCFLFYKFDFILKKHPLILNIILKVNGKVAFAINLVDKCLIALSNLIVTLKYALKIKIKLYFKLKIWLNSTM